MSYSITKAFPVRPIGVTLPSTKEAFAAAKALSIYDERERFCVYRGNELLAVFWRGYRDTQTEEGAKRMQRDPNRLSRKHARRYR
jgi:hypothetical protein